MPSARCLMEGGTSYPSQCPATSQVPRPTSAQKVQSLHIDLEVLEKRNRESRGNETMNEIVQGNSHN